MGRITRKQFSDLVESHQRIVYAVAYGCVGRAALAEEIAQETFLLAWSKLDRLHTPGGARPWLCAIARRLAANARRRDRRELPVDSPETSGHDDPMRSILQREARHRVVSALESLPDGYRAPLVLFYHCDQDVRAVAKILEISEGAVRQRLRRARLALRDRLESSEREVRALRPGRGFRAAVVAAVAAGAGGSSARAMATMPARAAVAGKPAIFVTAALAAIALAPSPELPTAEARAVIASEPPGAAGGRGEAHRSPTGPAALAVKPNQMLSARSAAPRSEPAAAVRSREGAVGPPVGATLDLAAMPRAPAPAGHARTLERALERYRRGDYHSSALLLALAARDPSNATADRERAELHLAIALYRIGFPTAAGSRLEAIARKREHGQRRAAVPWLLKLARELPESPALGAILADQPAAALSELDSYRGDVSYHIGRHFFVREPRRAARALRSVPPGSPFHLRALLLAAVAHARVGELADAARDYRAVFDAADALDDRQLRQELMSRAMLGLGRLYYSAGQPSRAVDAYIKVPSSAPQWSEALFESSWAFLREGNAGRSLGQLHTLRAPHFDFEIYPEAALVAAIAYWNACHFRRAEREIARFHRRFNPVIAKLGMLANLHPNDDAAYYRWARSLRERHRRITSDRFVRATQAGHDRHERPAAVAQRLAAASLLDRELDRAMATVEVLEDELARVERQDRSWQATTLGVELLQELATETSLAEARAGDLARSRIRRVRGELRALRGEMRRIKIVILRAYEELGGKTRAREPEPRIYAIDDQMSYWPWDGEFWRDELGRYTVELKTVCR